MQVRVFESTDMASGLKMIKKELGPDALILSTRTIRSGKIGLLGQTMLEITAAVDSDLPKGKIGREGKADPKTTFRLHPEETERAGFTHVVDDNVDEFLSPNNPADNTGLPESPATVTAAPRENDQGLQDEVSELKYMVKNLAGQISQLSEKDESSNQISHSTRKLQDADFVHRLNSNTIYGDNILTMLLERGVNVQTSRTIVDSLIKRFPEEQLSNPDTVTELLTNHIQDLIEVNPPVLEPSKKQHRLALIGPTGVGKTTTLAKIAASYLSQHSNSIALITIDTYRIAAVEQLKVYGEIMHLPVDVVISPEQLEKAIEKHSDKQLILIDTAGRSPRDKYCIDELATFLRPELDIDKHLVLSATTRDNELLEIIDRFHKLTLAGTIFTKVDECASLGVLLNVQLQNSNPLSYVTNGQRVPEDLLEISPKIIAELIMSQNEGSLHD